MRKTRAVGGADTEVCCRVLGVTDYLQAEQMSQYGWASPVVWFEI